MRKIIHILALITFSTFIQAQDTTRVLFIGNSITYFNNMPQTFEAIANSKGDTTEVTVYAPGGTGFINHVTDPNVFVHFREGDWDYIVLQPGSNESPGYSHPIDQTLSRARVLQDSIYKYNPCVKILFYQISYGVWGSSTTDLTTYNNTMSLIRSNLTYLADSTETFFAPVGEAFHTAWNQNQNDLLWGGFGDIHPNAEGSYIAACVFYATIFQKTSRGSTVWTSLSGIKADNYQELADTIVLNNLSNWNVGTYDQSTAFSYTINGNTVDFTNLSLNVDSLLWDFGNLTTATNQNPITHYSTSGNYDVTLTTYKNGCVESISQRVSLGVLELEKAKIHQQGSAYPNPTKDYLNIKLKGVDENYHFEVYNKLGQLLLQTKTYPIDVSNLKRGIYYLNVINSETLERHMYKWQKYL